MSGTDAGTTDDGPAGAEPAADRRRSTFGPVLLLGLAGAALAAVGATRVWFTASGSHGGVPLDPVPGGTDLTVVTGTLTGADVNPLVSALALVALACWGAVLVLRGRVRRVVGALGLVVSVGALVGVVTSLVGRDAAALPSGPAAESMSAWPWVTGIGLLATSVAFLGAVRDAGGWPTMSSRYDTPTGPTGAAAVASDGPGRQDGQDGGTTRPAGQEDQRAVWRALDEGHDPTA